MGEVAKFSDINGGEWRTTDIWRNPLSIFVCVI